MQVNPRHAANQVSSYSLNKPSHIKIASLKAEIPEHTENFFILSLSTGNKSSREWVSRLSQEMQKATAAQHRAELDEIHKDLEKVYKVSVYLDFPFTVDEVATYFLPRSRVTGEKLHSLIVQGRFADLPFLLRDGYLLTNAGQTQTDRLEREKTSADKLDAASAFAATLTRLVPFILTVAVTGSSAYGSARKWDDIDLFIITKRNRLWLSAFLALIFVRVTKLLKVRPPHLSPFCLSYVHDEHGFANESHKNRTNPLFARELLKARPVAGRIEYRRILEENGWVGKFYSDPYASTLRELGNRTGHMKSGGMDDPTAFSRSFPLDWVDSVLFVFLSRYLHLRAYLTNLKLKSEGQRFRVFAPEMSPLSCVYTSNFYRWLQELWSN